MDSLVLSVPLLSSSLAKGSENSLSNCFFRRCCFVRTETTPILTRVSLGQFSGWQLLGKKWNFPSSNVRNSTIKAFANKVFGFQKPRMGLTIYTPICFSSLDFNKHHSLPSFSLHPCVSSTARYAVQFTLLSKNQRLILCCGNCQASLTPWGITHV